MGGAFVSTDSSLAPGQIAIRVPVGADFVLNEFEQPIVSYFAGARRVACASNGFTPSASWISSG